MLSDDQLEQWELASAYIAPDEDTDPQAVFTAKTVRILCAEVRRLKADYSAQLEEYSEMMHHYDRRQDKP